MTKTDFDFYTNKYYGNVIPFSLYDKYELKARTKVDVLSLKRINDMDDNIRKCVCAVADYLYEKNTDEVSDMEIVDIMFQFLDINLVTRAI